MIIDLIEWVWDHWQEVTFNTLLLFILRKFILKELTKLFRFNRNVASLNNQRVIMRELGVEKEWDAGRPNLNRITVTKSLNGLRTITSHVHITELFTRRMAIKKLYWRKLKMSNYLNKLSRTKLQVYIVFTIVNMYTLFATLAGSTNIDAGLQPYMPGIDLVAQLVAGWVYSHYQGKVDVATVQGGNPVADTKPTIDLSANK